MANLFGDFEQYYSSVLVPGPHCQWGYNLFRDHMEDYGRLPGIKFISGLLLMPSA